MTRQIVKRLALLLAVSVLVVPALASAATGGSPTQLVSHAAKHKKHKKIKKRAATPKNGVNGHDGAAGAPGLQGPAGVNGRDGVDGKDGAPGQDGAPGLDGAPGRDGVDGKDGAPGQNGAPGENGAPGLSAYQEWLAEGNSGTVGDFMSSLKGPKGDNGAQGPKGDTGAQGPKGDPGIPNAVQTKICTKQQGGGNGRMLALGVDCAGQSDAVTVYMPQG